MARNIYFLPVTQVKMVKVCTSITEGNWFSKDPPAIPEALRRLPLPVGTLLPLPETGLEVLWQNCPPGPSVRTFSMFHTKQRPGSDS